MYGLIGGISVLIMIIAVYMDLKFQIRWYVETWARLCSVAFKDEDYRQENILGLNGMR